MASTLFPPDFIWGAATSAFQIEGSPLADGAGPSNWQAFCHEPGRVINNDHGDLACDHYRRYPEDIRLMQEIGLGAYRFSINWARIFPEGRGRLNVAGLDFYKRLLDKLEVAGITPYVTLHHWDYPLALSERGGWQERDSAPWFADYSAAIFQALGTRISHWSTFNEPWVMVHEGYVAGSHPPGVTDMTKARVATHNILRAHGMAVQAFRAETQGEIGIVVNLEPKDPASDSALDLAATRRADAWMNRQFLDPLLLGHYPEELEELWGNTGQPIAEEDFRLIQTPIDFVGINYYSRSVVRNAPQNAPFRTDRVEPLAERTTDMGWEIFPEGLTRCLLWVKDRYGEIPLYITENGAAFDDGPNAEGRITDQRRTNYFRSHLLAAHKAIAAGAPLKGYFAWSLLDNFEWAFGYAKRFGLIHVDFKTQTRTLKDSAHFYREVIQTGGANLEE
ncbi:MAG: hypothetical protein RLZ25_115 [Pseudomonadota bacterium]